MPCADPWVTGSCSDSLACMCRMAAGAHQASMLGLLRQERGGELLQAAPAGALRACTDAAPSSAAPQEGHHLPRLAVGRDEGCVGGGRRLGPVSSHALVDLQRTLRQPRAVARVDDGVVRAHLRLDALSTQARLRCWSPSSWGQTLTPAQPPEQWGPPTGCYRAASLPCKTAPAARACRAGWGCTAAGCRCCHAKHRRTPLQH